MPDKKKYQGIKGEYEMKTKLHFVVLVALLVVFVSGCGKVTQSGKTEATWTERPETTEPHEPIVRKATLAVVGDIMVHDYQYNEAYDASTGNYDFMHNFQDMKKYFEGRDFVIGNLETTFGGPEKKYSSFPMFNTPDSFLDALKDAGFNLVTTANNHSMDTFQSGVKRTLDKLDEYDIEHVGTYRSQEERDKILIKEVNGIEFAFLSYTYGTNGISVPKPYLVSLLDEEKVREDIAKAKKMADMVIILPHMGNEYESEPNDTFKGWADIMFEAGADMILASHPHVLQPMEYRMIENGDGTQRKGFICYSLGNFISSQTTPPRNASIVLHITVEKTDDKKPIIQEVSFVPIWTQFRNAKNQNHFVVRSVYTMLNLPQEEIYQTIRQKDHARLQDIHYETTSLLLGNEVPFAEIQDEYVIK